MNQAIKGLKPAALWQHFYEISQIPRCSRHEEKIREYVLSVGERNGLKHQIDAAGSMVIRKPASKGAEKSPGIILQSHLDMVCEKNKDTRHDFSRDPIRLVRKGDWIAADGTTLGSDNGIGVAAALAVMEDQSLPHGPIEFLFTIDEETGLTGATQLGNDMLKHRILLNMDSEEDGAIYIGCAGGRDTELFLPLETEKMPAGHKLVRIRVGGLQGGHSGLQIDQGLGNALKLMTRLLFNLTGKVDIRLAHIDGGSKHNAIPRECDAVVAVPADQLSALKKEAARYQQIFRDELKQVDAAVSVQVDESGVEKTERVFKRSLQSRLINLLYAMPHGVLAMSQAVPGLVETSTNMAVLKTADQKISLLTSQRSSVSSGLDWVVEMVQSAGQLAGAEVHHGNGYPAWQPNPDSPLLKKAEAVYQKLFKVAPHIKAIHAGLECGIIGDKFPGMDMISFGPTIMGAHSPDEKVQISTVEKFWDFLAAMVKELSR